MRTALLIIALALGGATHPQAADRLRLTTLDWPPYVDATGNGQSTDTVRHIFKLAGAEIDVQVFPWNRAIRLAAESPQWIGVYPEYYSELIDAEAGGGRCLFSQSFGTSPVGFLKRKKSRFTWTRHEDLARFTLGVVRGYVNEKRLDEMIVSGKIRAELAENDRENILKVAAGRANAAVIDRNVFAYLAEFDRRVARVAGKLEFHSKLLVEHSLHICFENSAAGRAARDVFDRTLASVPQPHQGE